MRFNGSNLGTVQAKKGIFCAELSDVYLILISSKEQKTIYPIRRERQEEYAKEHAKERRNFLPCIIFQRDCSRRPQIMAYRFLR